MAANPGGNLTLAIEDLSVAFDGDAGSVRVVDGVSLSVPAGKTVALVGESGCGKTVTALSILRLLAQPPARIERGRIHFRGRGRYRPVDLLELDQASLRHVRGGQIGMVFQEPMTALNPVMTVGRQLVEAVRVHRSIKHGDARRLAVAALGRAGIREPARRFDAYPHQLSGGMRQRVLIAMALINDPALLIADEPTTALDTTIQMHLLMLFKELQRESGMGILLITHDLCVVAEIADFAYVCYAGRIVEQAPVAELFAQPRHPYTQGLMRCTPRLDAVARRLEVIPGSVPDFAHPPPGCRFHPRCQLTRKHAADAKEESIEIPVDLIGPAHAAATSVLENVAADSHGGLEAPNTVDLEGWSVPGRRLAGGVANQFGVIDLPDNVPNRANAGTRVARRCIEELEGQPSGTPPLQCVGPDHQVACWFAE